MKSSRYWKNTISLKLSSKGVIKIAERRMFAKSIIGSARFLRMPPSSRLLYYDLGMYADDDGVVEAFSVMRQTNATEDDLRVLVSKGFVVILNDDLVAVITDWHVNNLIRNDRYHPSIYKDLLLQLDVGKPNDNQMDTSGKPRLGEVSQGKDSVGKDSIPTPPTIEEVREYFKEKNFIIDPDFFYNYYTEGGWMSKDRKGNPVPIKRWKQKAIVWNQKELEKNPNKQPPSDLENDLKEWIEGE